MGIFLDFFNFLDSLSPEGESGSASHHDYTPSFHIWEGPLRVSESEPPEGVAWKEDK